MKLITTPVSGRHHVDGTTAVPIFSVSRKLTHYMCSARNVSILPRLIPRTQRIRIRRTIRLRPTQPHQKKRGWAMTELMWLMHRESKKAEGVLASDLSSVNVTRVVVICRVVSKHTSHFRCWTHCARCTDDHHFMTSFPPAFSGPFPPSAPSWWRPSHMLLMRLRLAKWCATISKPGAFELRLLWRWLPRLKKSSRSTWWYLSSMVGSWKVAPCSRFLLKSNQ